MVLTIEIYFLVSYTKLLRILRSCLIYLTIAIKVSLLKSMIIRMKDFRKTLANNNHYVL